MPPLTRSSLVLCAPALAGTLLLAGCARSAPSETVADVDGQPITAADVDRDLARAFSQIEEQKYAMRRERIDALIAQRALENEAKRQGMTVPELVAREVDANAARITDQDVENFCASRPDQCGEGQDGMERRAAIKDQMQAQRLGTLRAKYVQQLVAGAKVSIRLQPPEPFRVDVADGSLPPRGAADAPITIVEFSDYHCPYCKRVQPTLHRLLQTYPDQIRLVYRDNPIDQLHPEARRVSEAARCANDQGRFWEFHDRLYAGPARGSDEVLRAAAMASGVDVARMEKCLAAGTHRAAVQADVEEAARLEANATPAFFINGIELRGAQPYEAFVRIIDRELKSGRSDAR